MMGTRVFIAFSVEEWPISLRLLAPLLPSAENDSIPTTFGAPDLY